MKIDLEQVRSLLDIVSRTDVTELTIEAGEEKITIKKPGPHAVQATVDLPLATAPTISMAPHPVQPQMQATPAPLKVEEENNGTDIIPITSPMVGTFYRASSPSAAPFVNVGDVIKSGQTVCIIEAMKLMNDLPTEIAGRVVKVCVENGTTVEYGQPLFMVSTRV
ncbi:MAG: acetyl-CoA carboxylase biotin carboxyl carrier protein [Candidatus Obscuribacterales bacterium]|nr:acetyl-CoA carboxylase biotin carboxyl carrier protein [Candidatus Obscuribacterales bacterium]